MKEERNRHGRGGSEAFTLIEVLLVVAILAILAAVVVVSLGGRREEAMINATRASIKGIGMAAKLYEIDTGRYPSSVQALVENDGSPNWNGPYVEGSTPVDPWGVAFSYTLKGDRSFEIRSAGPDTQMNTGDDITN